MKEKKKSIRENRLKNTISGKQKTCNAAASIGIRFTMILPYEFNRGVFQSLNTVHIHTSATTRASANRDEQSAGHTIQRKRKGAACEGILEGWKA
jgi:hypothetical protein